MAEDIYVQKTNISGNSESTETVKLFDVFPRIQLLGFSLPTIYAFTGGMARIPRQEMVPKVADTYPGTIVKGKMAITYNLDPGAEGEFEIYNYTDEAIVAGSQFTVDDDSGNWVYACGPEVDLVEGKDYSIRGRRKVGQGNDKFLIEAATLILRYE